MPKKILVADDSLTIQKVVELTFSDADYRLTCVANGRLALQKVSEDPPDLILADVVMPEKNGYEVCEAIKRNPATAGIPVVLLAGTFEPFDRDRAERLGCDAIVSKPFDSRELHRKVETLLAARGEAAPAAVGRAEGASVTTDGPAWTPAARETPVIASPPRSAFESGFAPTGFSEEDFTGSIRNLRGAASADALESLYGPEDVETALAAFHEVEPSPEPVARQRDTPVVPIERREAPEASSDGRTQRIDVSRFRSPRSTDPAAGRPAPIPEKPSEVGEDTAPSALHVEPMPPLPVAPARDEVAPHPDPLAKGEWEKAAPSAGAATRGERGALRELTDSEIERLAERLAAKVVEKLSDKVVKEVAWEVVPEMAELVVRERIRELESGSE
jgi:CheY-like chemotaxis protein